LYKFFTGFDPRENLPSSPEIATRKQHQRTDSVDFEMTPLHQIERKGSDTACAIFKPISYAHLVQIHLQTK
jgi:hypothetical protein